jgi:membrane protease YdiL (CAAX protease family)
MRTCWPLSQISTSTSPTILKPAFGLLGAIGEEIGWRGYLQPRLDQLAVPGSLFWVIALETLFDVPLILIGGYLAGMLPVTVYLLTAAAVFGTMRARGQQWHGLVQHALRGMELPPECLTPAVLSGQLAERCTHPSPRRDRGRRG